MPAYAWEVHEALAEGVRLHHGWGIVGFRGEGRLPGAVELKRCLAVLDHEGRFRPQYDESVRDALECDTAVVAIGMGADTGAFPAVSGPRSIVADRADAADRPPLGLRRRRCGDRSDHHRRGRGDRRRAAFMVDRHLQGLELSGWEEPLPVVDKTEVLARQRSYSWRPPWCPRSS